MGEQRAQEAGVRRQAEDRRVGERAVQPGERGRAVGAVRDHLGDHRVVVRADDRARLDRGVDAHAVGVVRGQHRAGGREEARVLGVDAGLDRVAGHGHLDAFEGLPRRHAQLQLDEVEAGDQLGDRVLDLQPRVHLEEEVRGRVVGVGDELDRARAVVARGLGQRDGLRAQRRAQRVRDDRRRRLLEHLLVAALQRAFALAEREHGAVRVADHLDLDVPRARQEALDEHAVVAEAGRRFSLRRRDRLVEAVGGLDDAHPAPAAARRGLDQQRIGVAGARLLEAQRLHDRHARARRRLLRADLVAHQLDRLRRRPDEDHARFGAGARERRVLGQEAVARVQRVDAARRRDHVLDRQVGADADGRVRLTRCAARRRRRRCRSPRERMPSACSVRITRRAISPRLATRTELNITRRARGRSPSAAPRRCPRRW